MATDSIAGSSMSQPPHHELSYGLAQNTAPPHYSNSHADNYGRGLTYPSSRAGASQQQQQQPQRPQHIPVATMGYEHNIPSLQAAHLPIPALQQPHTYPSQIMHSPPAHTQIGYQWDSRN